MFASWQTPLMHTPTVQTLPHAPQFLISDCTLMQLPLQPTRPLPQINPHDPFVHVAVPVLDGQTFPQAPQLFMSVFSLTQAPPQAENPGLQL